MALATEGIEQPVRRGLDKSVGIMGGGSRPLGTPDYGTAAEAAVVTELLTVDTLVHLRGAQGILRLAETFGAARLNAACRRARHFGDGRYQTVKGILLKALDGEPLPDTPVSSDVLRHTHLRGPDAFRP